MKILTSVENERGVALVTALLLTLISLGIVLATLYFISRGTELSAAAKRYKSALEASHGGAEVVAGQLIPRAFNSTSDAIKTIYETSLGMTVVDNDCLQEKISKNTADWVSCTTADLMNPTASPDFTFLLKGDPLKPGFRVYAKIVDAVPGNSDSSETELDSGDAVTGIGTGVTPMHAPAMYRIEVQGERADNPKERANLSVLYAY